VAIDAEERIDWIHQLIPGFQCLKKRRFGAMPLAAYGAFLVSDLVYSIPGLRHGLIILENENRRR